MGQKPKIIFVCTAVVFIHSNVETSKSLLFENYIRAPLEVTGFGSKLIPRVELAAGSEV